MADRISLDDFAQRCGGTDDMLGLWRSAVDFFRSRGMVRMSFHSNDSKRPGWPPLGIQIENFPQAWIDRYVAGGLWRSDPIPELARRLGRPFWWRDIRTLTKLTATNIEYLDLAASHGLGDGLAIQIFGPNMYDALLNVGFGETRPDLLPSAIFEMQSAAQIAHLRYCVLTGKTGRLTQELSPRELEVLRWLARGKSNSVIAEIMGISRHTVDTMLRRLFDKLDANDRTTAVLRGVKAGFLHVEGRDVS